MRLFLLCVVLISPITALACFQTDIPTAKVQNTEIKGRFMFEGKPIVNAFVTLRNKKTRGVKSTHTDETGQFTFKDLPSGEYKVAMVGPSNESFDVIFKNAPFAKDSIVINFFDDWCISVRVLREIEHAAQR